MRYHYTPTRVTKPSIDEAVEQLEFSLTAGGNAKYYNHFGKKFGNLL